MFWSVLRLLAWIGLHHEFRLAPTRFKPRCLFVSEVGCVMRGRAGRKMTGRLHLRLHVPAGLGRHETRDRRDETRRV